MFKQHFSLLLLLIFLPLVSTYSQDYNRYFNEGKRLHDKGEYNSAIDQYNAAFQAATTLAQKEEVRDAIQKAAEDLAFALKQAEIAKEQAVEERKNAERAQKKNKKAKPFFIHFCCNTLGIKS